MPDSMRSRAVGLRRSRRASSPRIAEQRQSSCLHSKSSIPNRRCSSRSTAALTLNFRARGDRRLRRSPSSVLQSILRHSPHAAAYQRWSPRSARSPVMELLAGDVDTTSSRRLVHQPCTLCSCRAGALGEFPIARVGKPSDAFLGSDATSTRRTHVSEFAGRTDRRQSRPCRCGASLK